MPKIKKPTIIRQEEVVVKMFKKALVEKGWQSQHLAKLCQMKPSQMSRVLNHPMNVQFDTILTIASKLGIDSIPIL